MQEYHTSLTTTVSGSQENVNRGRNRSINRSINSVYIDLELAGLVAFRQSLQDIHSFIHFVNTLHLLALWYSGFQQQGVDMIHPLNVVEPQRVLKPKQIAKQWEGASRSSQMVSSASTF